MITQQNAKYVNAPTLVVLYLCSNSSITTLLFRFHFLRNACSLSRENVATQRRVPHTVLGLAARLRSLSCPLAADSGAPKRCLGFSPWPTPRRARRKRSKSGGYALSAREHGVRDDCAPAGRRVTGKSMSTIRKAVVLGHPYRIDRSSRKEQLCTCRLSPFGECRLTPADCNHSGDFGRMRSRSWAPWS